MTPWRTTVALMKKASQSSLQWGHGDDAVENPVPFELEAQASELQWGHGDDAVENLLPHTPSAKGSPLQWGHGDDAVENKNLLRLLQ